MTITRKKLIEVALPLEAINAASAREKTIRHGHPSTLHQWWARRPLAAARAVIFAQMIDDPSACPEEFPTPDTQEAERQRLFRLIEQLVLWENMTNETVLQAARDEIWKSWRRTCADNRDDPRAAHLFTPEKLPPFHDPFAGGGALPLEAQRLGMEAYASDLNPVAVLICKAMIEIPPKFAGRPPVNPDSRAGRGSTAARWNGASGLAEDVRYYGKWMRDEAEKRIGHLYPRVQLPGGAKADVIAWIWARTVRCPNPACGVQMPLVRSFWLAKSGRTRTWIEPEFGPGVVRYRIVSGTTGPMHEGTVDRRGATCVACGANAPLAYVRAEGQRGAISHVLMAVAAEGARGREYLDPTAVPDATVGLAPPTDVPDTELPNKALGFRVQAYGFRRHRDLFTVRQLHALATFAELVSEARGRAMEDSILSGLDADSTTLRGNAIAVYLSFALDKMVDLGNSICPWEPIAQCPRNMFGRQAISMQWSFAEANPFSSSSGSWNTLLENQARSFASSFASSMELRPGTVRRADAQDIWSSNAVVSTDPPYYDNIGYADLSDVFYVWLRKALGSILPELFDTVLTPKNEELVANPFRFEEGMPAARRFFEDGMFRAFSAIRSRAIPSHPFTVFYAFKQVEEDDDDGETESGVTREVSTGWEAMLEGLVGAGWVITATWPMRTEMSSRMRNRGSNALASSIVIAAMPRGADAPTATRAEFLEALSTAMRGALPTLSSGNIAPVDLAQASIGPGMAVYSKYGKVLRQDGKPVTVREALQDINNAISAYRTERTSSFDPRTRFCIDFYDQFGFAPTEFDNATVLARAQAVGIDTLENDHLLTAERGRAWLVPLGSYPAGVTGLERRFGGSAWEACMRLAATLEEEGEAATAALARELGEGVCARARELAVWLFTIADARKRAQDALAFNALDASWTAIQRLMASLDRGGQQGRFA